jgi:hypothetical protein
MWLFGTYCCTVYCVRTVNMYVLWDVYVLYIMYVLCFEISGDCARVVMDHLMHTTAHSRGTPVTEEPVPCAL